jgi:Rieske Fe-S protein
LALVTVLLVLAAGTLIVDAVNSRRHHGTPAVVAIDVRGIASGGVLTTRYTVAAGGLQHAPVFLARETDGAFVAFLGRSTHLGCRVVLASDALHAFTHASNVAFEDPCGGSVWALDGDCIGGPCPRGLSTFPLKVTGSVAEIDLTRAVPGTPRLPA